MSLDPLSASTSNAACAVNLASSIARSWGKKGVWPVGALTGLVF